MDRKIGHIQQVISGIILCGLFFLITSVTFAQNEKRLIRKGNTEYYEGNYKDAEINYIKSRESKDHGFKGLYNLGNARYMQNNYSDAAAAFDTLMFNNLNEETKSKAFYNLGNSLLKLAQDTSQQAQNTGEALPASIEAFKESLRISPEDQDAKYNLAYAQKLLRQQQQQQQQQNQQDQKDQKDQKDKQDQQNQDQQEQQQDQQEQQQEQQEQQQQQRQQEISKEDAERILEALKNDEKETLEKLKKIKIKATGSKSEKDW